MVTIFCRNFNIAEKVFDGSKKNWKPINNASSFDGADAKQKQQREGFWIVWFEVWGPMELKIECCRKNTAAK